MTIYRKVACHIWTDSRFRRCAPEQKLEIIEAIVFNRIEGHFAQYRGTMWREADEPRRRPDLSSAEWRALRMAVIQEQGTICAYCQQDCHHDPTVDHVIPVSRGVNPLDKTNLVVSCRACNSGKGGKEGWE